MTDLDMRYQLLRLAMIERETGDHMSIKEAMDEIRPLTDRLDSDPEIR